MCQKLLENDRALCNTKNNYKYGEEYVYPP